jgi:hypothetical protein
MGGVEWLGLGRGLICFDSFGGLHYRSFELSFLPQGAGRFHSFHHGAPRRQVQTTVYKTEISEKNKGDSVLVTEISPALARETMISGCVHALSPFQAAHLHRG